MVIFLNTKKSSTWHSQHGLTCDQQIYLNSQVFYRSHLHTHAVGELLFSFQTTATTVSSVELALKGPLSTLLHCASRAQIQRITCDTKFLIVVKGFSKELVSVGTALAIRSKQLSAALLLFQITFTRDCKQSVFSRIQVRTNSLL